MPETNAYRPVLHPSGKEDNRPMDVVFGEIEALFAQRLDETVSEIERTRKPHPAMSSDEEKVYWQSIGDPVDDYFFASDGLHKFNALMNDEKTLGEFPVVKKNVDQVEKILRAVVHPHTSQPFIPSKDFFNANDFPDYTWDSFGVKDGAPTDQAWRTIIGHCLRIPQSILNTQRYLRDRRAKLQNPPATG